MNRPPSNGPRTLVAPKTAPNETIDVEQLREAWQFWTGRAVAGEGIQERLNVASRAADLIAAALPLLLDEVTELRARTAAAEPSALETLTPAGQS